MLKQTPHPFFLAARPARPLALPNANYLGNTTRSQIRATTASLEGN